MNNKCGWFKEAVFASNLPTLLKGYNIETLVSKSHSVECITIHMDILTCAYAICDIIPNSKNEEISDESFSRIIEECNFVLDFKPKNRIYSLRNLGLIRNLRPSWFSIPIYEEILKPFNREFNTEFGYSVEEVFKAISALTKFRSESSSIQSNFQFPQELNAIVNDLTISVHDINSLEDIWDKLFIVFDNNILLFLDYKVGDVFYSYLCRRLKKYKKFIYKKGHSIENLVERKMTEFMPNSTIYKSYHIDGKEKDILVIHKNFGFCIECKSASIRKSSIDWSQKNLFSDIDKSYSQALSQIEEPFTLLSEGGKFQYKNNIHKVKAKDYYFGFIITDQVYSPFIRAAIDEVRVEQQDSLGQWHGNNIWIGSIIDFIFLLNVSKTPSILLDYFNHVRSVKDLRNTDEPESWLLYGMDTLMPNLLKIPKEHNFNLILNGFDWDKIKTDGFEYYRPFWLLRLEDITNLDRLGRFANAKNIIIQDKKRSIKLVKDRRNKI